MIYVYLASMIVGGVLLGGSLLFGGDDHDADGDVDADGDFDADADGDLELHVDKDLHLELDGGGLEIFWWLRSLRFWTFFGTFFGTTGVLLQLLNLAGPTLTLLLALGVGLLTGGGAAAVIRALRKNSVADVAGDAHIIGQTGRVIVPADPGGVARVRVEVRGEMVDLLAEGDTPLAREDQVIVVEMEGTHAKVARIDD